MMSPLYPRPRAIGRPRREPYRRRQHHFPIARLLLSTADPLSRNPCRLVGQGCPRACL